MSKFKFSLFLGIIFAAVLVGCGGFVYTTVGGAVTGLHSSGSNSSGNSITLQNDQGYVVTLSNDGPFSFKVASNAKYEITVAAQPGTVHCTVVNGKGTMTGEASLNNIQVNCTPNAIVGGTFKGLFNNRIDTTLTTNLIQLLINDSAKETVTSSKDDATPTIFVLATTVIDKRPYNITLSSQPIGEICTLQNGAGIADASAGINNLVIDCAAGVPLSGVVNGLDVIAFPQSNQKLYLTDGIQVKALNNDGSTGASVPYTFLNSVADTKPYAVTVAQQPLGKTCTVNDGSGTASLANRTAASNIVVNCVNN